MGSAHSAVFVDLSDDVMPTLNNNIFFFQISSQQEQPNASPYKHETVPWSLIGSIVFMTGLLYTYYLTVHKYMRYPSWYWIPMISFCGCYQPEQFIWKLTWIIAGISQCIAQYTITDTHLYKQFLAHAPSMINNQSRFWITFHAFASILIGIFHLKSYQCQDPVSAVNDKERMYEPDPEAIMHYISAVMAGIGGLIGITSGIVAYGYAFKHISAADYYPKYYATMQWFLGFRLICAMFMWISVFIFIGIGPICIYLQGYVTYNIANLMSLGEWVLAFSMGLYDACISLENYYIVEYMNEDKKNV